MIESWQELDDRPTETTARITHIEESDSSVVIHFKSSHGECGTDTVSNSNRPNSELQALLTDSGLPKDSDSELLVNQSVPVRRESASYSPSEQLEHGQYVLDIPPQNGVGWKLAYHLKRIGKRYGLIRYGFLNPSQMYAISHRVGYHSTPVGNISILLALILTLTPFTVVGSVNPVFTPVSNISSAVIGIISLLIGLYIGVLLLLGLAILVKAPLVRSIRAIFPVNRFE